ncbi:MAG: hypothetical protein Q8T09_21605 [Candidatus Melainabacteria bacterium]|nr:hypothetical protein [Candidatus Melainabacteria bacterium]
MATGINANANLTTVGVTASASSTVLNIKSASINNTTYTKSLSGGATETITLAPATSVSQYSYTILTNSRPSPLEEPLNLKLPPIKLSNQPQ